MATKFSAGFTIIETMLFLAISGTLVVVLLAGTGASINIQRYRDATESFKNLLQTQYSELISVKNDRDNGWTCDATGKTTQQATTLTRGQSGCVLLGRYITIVDSKISIYSVTGYQTGNTLTGTDIAKMRADYTLNISTVNREDSELEWGTRISWPTVRGSETTQGTSTRSISILLVRSPTSGLIYTFTSDLVPATVSSTSLKNMMIVSASNPLPVPGQRARYICVDSSAFFNLTAAAFNNSTASIYISAYATGPTAIETRTNAFIKDLSPAEALRC